MRRMVSYYKSPCAPPQIFSAGGAGQSSARLVAGGGSVDMIDHEYVYRALGRFQLQAELFL